MLLFFSWSIKNQPKIFLDLIFFGSRLFWTKLVFDPTFFTLFKKIGSKEVLSKNVGPQKLRPTNNESKKLPTHHPPGTLVHEMTTWKWWPELSKGSLRIKKCHSNICPYQEYPSCCWPYFDQTFCTQFSWALIFVGQHFFGPKSIDPNIFWTKYVFGFFWTKLFLDQYFFI